MNRFQRFMYGRCGSDQLFLFILVLALLMDVLAGLPHLSLLRLAALALLAFDFYRFFSRDLARRSAENAAYLARRSRVLSWFSLQHCRWRDRRSHTYFPCPKCGQTLRVPKKQGRILVTCTKCGWEFEKQT